MALSSERGLFFQCLEAIDAKMQAMLDAERALIKKHNITIRYAFHDEHIIEGKREDIEAYIAESKLLQLSGPLHEAKP